MLTDDGFKLGVVWMKSPHGYGCPLIHMSGRSPPPQYKTLQLTKHQSGQSYMHSK